MDTNADIKELAEFQEANCRGCRFSIEAQIGLGTPCCHLIVQAQIKNGWCYSKVTKGATPTYACIECDATVKARKVPDNCYVLRLCEPCYAGRGGGH